jgi:hypothetical protein
MRRDVKMANAIEDTHKGDVRPGCLGYAGGLVP